VKLTTAPSIADVKKDEATSHDFMPQYLITQLSTAICLIQKVKEMRRRRVRGRGDIMKDESGERQKENSTVWASVVGKVKALRGP
jgi:hypothetical protein